MTTNDNYREIEGMRLVNRQELMTLPARTLFCPLHQEWVFGGLELKMETIEIRGENYDFWVKSLDWPESEHTGEAIDRLEEMAADSSVGYPVESASSRHGLYDDERLYLVYEPADTLALISLVTGV